MVRLEIGFIPSPARIGSRPGLPLIVNTMTPITTCGVASGPHPCHVSVARSDQRQQYRARAARLSSL